MRWGYWRKRAVSRVRITLLERPARPSVSRWVLVRDRDGRTWAGPYRWQGQTFTEAERFWYLFANIESAEAAIIGSGFFGVSVRQII
jgi:hypothetical protein